MNYTKPEVVLLGQAARVIENFIDKGTVNYGDGPMGTKHLAAAYDLDE
jgi:hypothetical protein